VGAVRTSHPRFRRQAPAPRIDLTSDDIEILRRVFRHRFIRAEDLYRLFPDRSPDKLSRRLTSLYRNQFLDRPIAQVDRFREGGSQSMVYGLDTAGARYLAENEGLSIRSGDWKARNRAYTRENLDHTLATTRFLVDLELACRARPDISFIPFEEILASAPEETRNSALPGRWRVPVRWADRSGTVDVVPDAIFGLRLQRPDGSSARSFVFLEIDRGTMTIVPAKQLRESDAFLHRATILRKVLTYAHSHLQAIHRNHLGVPVARVLTLTTSKARAEAMREATERLIVRPARLPPGLFIFGADNGGDPLCTAYVASDGTTVRLTG
jgi:hypothetical protein